MKLLVVASFVALASAIPAKRSQSNIPLDVAVPSTNPPVQDGATPFVATAADKVKRSAELKTRATLVVDVWQDSDRGGRHEGLYTDTQRCYDLGNGWNDAISSLSVPSGYGCNFYENSGCGGGWLQVPGGNYIANLNTYGYNDRISSYRCWN